MVRAAIGVMSVLVFMAFVTPVHAQQNQRYWQQQYQMRANAANNNFYNSYRAPRVYLPTPIYYPNYGYFRQRNFYSYPNYGNTTILPAPQNDNRLPTGGSQYFGNPHASQYFGNPNASQYFGN